LYSILSNLLDQPVVLGVGLQHVDGFMQREVANRPQIRAGLCALDEHVEQIDALDCDCAIDCSWRPRDAPISCVRRRTGPASPAPVAAAFLAGRPLKILPRFLRGRRSRGGGARSWPHRQCREFECQCEIRTGLDALGSGVRFSSYSKKPRFTAVRHDGLFSSCVA
jgi:hypothetical protein